MQPPTLVREWMDAEQRGCPGPALRPPSQNHRAFWIGLSPSACWAEQQCFADKLCTANFVLLLAEPNQCQSRRGSVRIHTHTRHCGMKCSTCALLLAWRTSAQPQPCRQSSLLAFLPSDEHRQPHKGISHRGWPQRHSAAQGVC